MPTSRLSFSPHVSGLQELSVPQTDQATVCPGRPGLPGKTSLASLGKFRTFHHRFAPTQVLLAGWLLVSSAGFSLVLGIGFWGFVKLLLYVIFVDCIGVGLLIATALWAVSNKYLLKPSFRDQVRGVNLYKRIFLTLTSQTLSSPGCRVGLRV